MYVFDAGDGVKIRVVVSRSRRDVLECNGCYVKESQGLHWRRLLYLNPLKSATTQQLAVQAL